MTPLLGSQHKAASGVRDNESIWKIQASAQICAVWPSGSDSTSLSTELSSHCCVPPSLTSPSGFTVFPADLRHDQCFHPGCFLYGEQESSVGCFTLVAKLALLLGKSSL